MSGTVSNASRVARSSASMLMSLAHRAKKQWTNGWLGATVAACRMASAARLYVRRMRTSRMNTWRATATLFSADELAEALHTARFDVEHIDHRDPLPHERQGPRVYLVARAC